MALFAVLAAIIAAVIYSSGISSPLYLDDPTVLQNAENFVATRPVGYLSFKLSHKLADIFGLVFPYDVTIYYRIPNVVIHVLATMAVFWLTRELTGRRLMAGLAGALFLVHPIQTQAVTYISQRFESQAALFMFISAAAYIRFRRGNSRLWIVASIVSGLAAAATKETAVALPVWLALIEIVFFSGFQKLKQIAIWLPFVGMVIYPAWRALEGAANAHTLTWIPFELYLLSQGSILLTYLRLVFLPGKQYLLYDVVPASGVTWSVVANWGLLVLLIAMSLYLVRRNRVAIFGILTFFLFLAPTSLMPIPDMIFEHRLYPALAGLAIALASAFPPNRLVVAGFSVVFVFLANRTYVRNGEWMDSIKFWELHREAFPQDAKVLGSLAVVYANFGEVNKAVAANLEAEKNLNRLNPFYYREGVVVVEMNLAALYSQMGDDVKAMNAAQRALSVESHIPAALRVVAESQYKAGDYEAALKTLKRLNPAANMDLAGLQLQNKVEEELKLPKAIESSQVQIDDMKRQINSIGPSLLANRKIEQSDLSTRQITAKKYLTPILFGFVAAGLLTLVLIYQILRRSLGEVIRWVTTGSTVSVESLEPDLPKE
jgi:tetratricopeptide (TPR) repeat protein